VGARIKQALLAIEHAPESDISFINATTDATYELERQQDVEHLLAVTRLLDVGELAAPAI
jgi:hypothetical protein